MHSRRMPVSPERTPLAESRARHGLALLITDMIGTWDFPDADKLAPRAIAMAPRLAALKARCRRGGAAVIYANDNQGRWRSDFRRLVEMAEAAGGAGARIAALLEPGDDDYFVLKPKHSAFFATPLDLLLRHLHVRRLIVTGVAADACIAATAAEAHARDYEVLVPEDCVAAQTKAREQRALGQLRDAIGVRTTASSRVRLARPG